MSKRYRLSLMGLSLFVLLIVGYWTNHAKYPDKRDSVKISGYEKLIKNKFASAIQQFLEGERSKCVFELTEITNNARNLEYTRWFFWVLFNIAKHYGNFGKRVCVVLEEAHTIIPEVSSMGWQTLPRELL